MRNYYNSPNNGQIPPPLRIHPNNHHHHHQNHHHHQHQYSHHVSVPNNKGERVIAHDVINVGVLKRAFSTL